MRANNEILRFLRLPLRSTQGFGSGQAPAVAQNDITQESDVVLPNAWQADLFHLSEVHHDVFEELSELDESGLDAHIAPSFSSVCVTLHGLVQHNLYHAGEIALLEKAVQSEESRYTPGMRLPLG